MHISFDCLATREQPADRARHSGAPRAIIPEQTVDKEPPAVANNLTRDEARDRASLISVESYEISLDLTGGEITFRSETTISFTAALPSAATDTVTATDADPDTATATFVDLVAPEVREITLNGTPVSLDAFTGDRIMLTGLQDGGNVLQVVADCAYSRTGEGLHRFTDPADKGVYLYSDLETFDAHRIYPCFDQPDLKARFAFTVTCPDTWVVVSNMAPVTAAAKHGPGTERWVFPPTPPMSTYITAIAAGPYHRVTADHDGIPLGIYCRQSLAQYLDPDEIFEITRQGFDYFHENFGVRYAFGKYDQLFVPEYKAGAMENAGCVTFLEDYIFRSRVTESERETRAETILHEMAHMWFGDLVTMRWWDDLWLNESFATWAGTVAQAEATRWPDAWTTFAQDWKAWAYRQDQLPSTHPIAADAPDIETVEVNFDGITYAKGAAVLKQLVAYVGRANFLAGVRAYFAEHAWGNATLADLLGALTKASGRDLAAWSKLWLETAGVNTLRPEFGIDASGALTYFNVRQEAAESHPVLRPHRIAVSLYDRTPDGLVRRRRVETDVAGELTAVPELDGQRRADLVLVNDDDLTYAKIRLDTDSLATLTEAIGEIRESLPAALCWAATWDMCRDAELPARQYVALVLSGAPSVTDIPVLQSVLQQASAAARRYADPAWRAAGVSSIAACLRELLTSAEPGSDRQLTFAQALAGVATSDDDLALLSGLLDGSAEVDGLTVDTELRWLLLRRLVSRGKAGQDAIDAEQDADRTDAGERHAAACRAALPDPAAKEEAWALITGGQLTNALFRATLDGFADVDQDELLAPYQERYYAVVGDLWQNWSTDMAQHFAAFAYPRRVVTPGAIAMTDDYLARTDPPAALRRLLTEGRDDVARALRCRERDTAAAAAPAAG
jgi:aminopeptidase N